MLLSSHFRLSKSLLEFLLFNLGIPAAFFCFVQCCVPIDQIFQFNVDEGMELAKVDLYTHGYQLYQEVWNDQPPLPTVLWAKWLEISHHHSIKQARLLTIGFSTVLVWSMSQIVRLTVGIVPALMSMIWLTSSFFFIQLSASVMMGLPSLSMAMLSAYFIVLHKKTTWIRYVFISALCFALSLHLKLFTVFLVIVFVLYLFYKDQFTLELKIKTRLRTALLWIASIGIAFLLIELTLPLPSKGQLVASHLSATMGNNYSATESFLNWLLMFVRDPDLWTVTVLGWRVFKENRKSLPIFPLLWLFFALAILLFYRPIWTHYYALISIPLVWATAANAQMLWTHLQKTYSSWPQAIRQRNPIAITLAMTILLIPIKFSISYFEIHNALKDSVPHLRVTDQLIKNRDRTHWLLTDLPMYGFRAQILVPPEIAVLSDKRLRSGNLTQSQIKEVLQHYQPEQVVLGRFQSIRDTLQPFLIQNYRLLPSSGGLQLYLKQPTSTDSNKP